jgi:hypothetical protein
MQAGSTAADYAKREGNEAFAAHLTDLLVQHRAPAPPAMPLRRPQAVYVPHTASSQLTKTASVSPSAWEQSKTPLPYLDTRARLTHQFSDVFASLNMSAQPAP